MGDIPRIGAPPAGVGLKFDVSLWPLSLMTMPPILTVADIAYMQECYELVFSAPMRHALIVDTTTLDGVPDATLRRQMKAFEDSRRLVIRQKNIGSAIIIQSAVVRGAYTALRWISPQPAPNRAFPNLREAAAWCVRGIEQDGQIVPIAAYRLAGLAEQSSAG